MKKILTVLLLGPLLSLLFLPGCGDEIPDHRFDFSLLEPRTGRILTVGEVPAHSIVEMLQRRQKFQAYLGEKLDLEVQFRFAASYEQIIDGLKNNRFDLAVLGPLAYVQAAEKTDYTPLVRPVRFGSPSYRAMIFTHAESGITSVSQLRDRTIAFVDPDSASGYLFPRSHMISEYNLDPETDMSRVSYVGGHDRVAEVVLDGQFAAGATYDDARMEIFETTEEADDNLPVLTRTAPIPSEPLVISPRIRNDEELYEKLKELLLNLHREEQGREALRSLGENMEELIPARDEDYDDVREVREILGINGEEN